MLARVRCVVFVGLLGPVLPGQETATEDLPAMLQRMVDVDWMWWRAPLPGERCVQFSSHDRRSARGPARADDWYANDDRGHYLRVVEQGGTKEHVMVDVDGPGCLARLWSANPGGMLHFDVDGARVWSVDFAQLCSGQVEGVPEPFAAMRARGGNLYLPILFAKHLTVSAAVGDLYYQADVLQFPPDGAVVGFTPKVLGEQKDLLAAVGKALGAASAGGETTDIPGDGVRVRIEPGRKVDEVLVRVRPRRPEADLGRALQSVRLVVRADKETTIDVPLPDFFGSVDWRPWQGHRLGITSQQAGYCHWPMPMPAGGSLELVLEPPGDAVDARLEVTHSPLAAAAPLRFRASYHVVKGQPARPFSDHLVLDAKGQGRFVGCSLLVRNPSRIWWGEGDEKFTVDGEAFPSWWGTGTEDYFGYAWCDPTPFQAPFHAQVECQGPGNFGFTQLHRTHVLDSVPFQRSFRFELERWHWVESAKVDYATVAYWYGAAEATSGLPPVPKAADRMLERLAGPPVFVAEGAVEGEALRVLSCSGGTHEVQDLGLFEATFSRDLHLWWRDGKPGDALVLAVPIAAAGRYRLTAAFTQADDFGIVQVVLCDQRLGEPLDGYAERVRSSGPRVLGVATLPAGQAELRLELVGRNPAAKPRHMVGLDYVRLEAVP